MHKHSRGAVTVFVTLLLIPAILVSGTGVDISRIYAARSMTRDANQLAANAILTEYNALLQDLYGLYAVINEDENLVAMVDTYVKASLFGEDVTDAQLGEFRLFTGTESVSSTVSSSDPLSNVEILRRQIEEYAKYRVPVAIVSDILDRLQNAGMQEMKANMEAAAKKIAVDEQLDEALKKFCAVIDEAEGLKKNYEILEAKAYKEINETMASISKQMVDMLQVRQQYENETDLEKKGDLLNHYNALAENIEALVYGGPVGYDWIPAHIDDNGNDVPGAWKEPAYQYSDGVKSCINSYVSDLKEYLVRLDELIALCQEADEAKNELANRISTLETKLNDNTCSDKLVKNMEEELITYKKFLNYNFTELGQQWKSNASNYITNSSVAPLEEIQGYGKYGESSYISFNNLRDIAKYPGFYIDLHINTALYQGVEDKLAAVVHDPVPVYIAWQSFPAFENISATHRECYELIKEFGIKSESEVDAGDKAKKSNFIKAFKTIKEFWDNLTDDDPSPGANTYTSNSTWAFSTKNAGMELDFGLSDFSFDGTEENDIGSTLKTFTDLISGNISATDLFLNTLANASNRVLLVGYATQMFSNWTTKGEIESGKTSLSLTGQPIDASNHYYLNSELEYLINGNLDAKSNLDKMTLTILALRFLGNYASSYIIDNVNGEIQFYKGVIRTIPFAGGALSLLVRPLIVLGESVVDVSLLRGGHAVLLLKTEDSDWHCSLEKLALNLLDDEEADTSDNERGLLYTDYLTIFLLASDPNVTSIRIGDLIALNVTTARENIAQNDPNTPDDERANAMTSVQLFDLSKAYTTFAIQTQTEVRFAFLSMPFAQQGINGVVPPTEIPVHVTTYRGY